MTSRWADRDEEEIKTITETKILENGKKVKVVKKIKQVRKTEKISNAVLQRKVLKQKKRRKKNPSFFIWENELKDIFFSLHFKKWVKFGTCAGKERGPESGVTEVSPEEIFLEASVEKVPQKGESSMKICRNCNTEDHWTANCPFKEEINPLLSVIEKASAEPRQRGEEEEGEEEDLHSSRGSLSSSRGALYKVPGKEATSAIRVNGISEDSTEDEIRTIFRKYGRVAKVHLVRNKESGEMRGFGFISFYTKDDAERAMKELQNYGHKNLIWYKPKIDYPSFSFLQSFSAFFL